MERSYPALKIIFPVAPHVSRLHPGKSLCAQGISLGAFLHETGTTIAVFHAIRAGEA
jgi:hypothetical protein